MKYLQRLFSVLLVCVIFVGLFSITAHAENEIEYKVTFGGYYTNPSETDRQLINSGETPVYNGGTLKKASDNDGFILNNSTFFTHRYWISDINRSILYEKGKEYTITIEGLWSRTTIGGSEEYLKMVDSAKINFYGLNDTVVDSFTNAKEYFVYNAVKKTHVYKLTFTPSEDISSITIVEKFTPSIRWGYVGTYPMQFAMGVENFKVSVSATDENTGLLSGILQWLKDLYNKVVNGFENLINGIKELPQKIWSFIENGLKSLFVPSEQFMTDYSTDWDMLLSQRFGAIYDVSNIIIDFVEQIQVSDKLNTIKMPSVDLNSVGIPFVFGGYDVVIVPQGFEVIVEILKKLISIVCTFLFINSLRKKYDEVMGVEQ